jgi:hypothetical protein
MSKEGERRSFNVLEGGLFLEAFPTKPLKPNLQNLTR